MEIIINKSSIETITNQVQNFLEKKDLSQITSHILLEAKDDILIVSATDYEIGLKIKTSNVSIKKEGKTTISGKKLLDIIKNLKNEDINISLDNEETIIKQNKIKFKLPFMIAKEFPKFPNKENKNILEIKNDIDISNILKVINTSIDNNNTKYEFNGALLRIENNTVSFISTDTKRLTISKIQEIESQELHNIIIPKKTINEIMKLFSKDINLFFDKTTIIIEKNNVFFYSKLINGSFPDVEKMVPKSFNFELKLVKDDFINSINIIRSVSEKMKIAFKENTIFFENIENLNIEAKTQLEVENDFNIFFSVDGNYILDFLYSIDEDIFIIKIIDENSPIELVSKNNKVVIMTVKEFN